MAISETVDVYKSKVNRLDEGARKNTGMSLAYWLTFGSIITSISFYLAGKKELAIFIGLWPPTFLALKSAQEAPDRPMAEK